MRVVGGTARGRTLVAPPGSRTRPTSDRVREAIFNALYSRGGVEGATVADLFAGSGALGIEALSRGAVHATFVDRDRSARHAIRRNLDACGFGDRATVVSAPVERWLGGLGDEARFDVVFCDPPYAFEAWPDLLVALPAELVVIEAAAPVALAEGWSIARSARYGGTWVGFAVPPADPPGDPPGGGGER